MAKWDFIKIYVSAIHTASEHSVTVCITNFPSWIYLPLFIKLLIILFEDSFSNKMGAFSKWGFNEYNEDRYILVSHFYCLKYFPLCLIIWGLSSALNKYQNWPNEECNFFKKRTRILICNISNKCPHKLLQSKLSQALLCLSALLIWKITNKYKPTFYSS